MAGEAWWQEARAGVERSHLQAQSTKRRADWKGGVQMCAPICMQVQGRGGVRVFYPLSCFLRQGPLMESRVISRCPSSLPSLSPTVLGYRHTCGRAWLFDRELESEPRSSHSQSKYPNSLSPALAPALKTIQLCNSYM